TDMTLDRTYQTGWLVLTNQRVFSIFEDHDAPEVEVPLEKVYGVDIDHFVGNGVLLVVTKTERIRLVRFSRRFAQTMEEAGRHIEAWVDQQVHALPRRDDAQNSEELGERQDVHHAPQVKRCPKCGRAMRGSVCVHCLQKSKLMLRVLGYVKPY